jgi:GNAT superfamily N-acetyltransferase
MSVRIGSARHALRADASAAANVLATAFADDPMISWLVGEQDATLRQSKALGGFFDPAIRAAYGRGHFYVIGAPLAGVALWSPPEVEYFDAQSAEWLHDALFDHVGEAGVGRLRSLGAMLADRHTDVPHFYLFLLGVARPGLGAGGSLLEPVLQRCDTDGLVAYLESTNPRNHGFYMRHGFDVVWTDRIDGANSPSISGLQRNPRRRAS